MTVVHQVASYRNLIVASFENAMGTMERVHQASMAMSVDLMKELGVPPGPADSFKAKHERMLHTIYGSICTVNAEFGEMIVLQVDNVGRFTRGVTDAILGADEGAATMEQNQTE